MTLLEESKALQPELVELRRFFHAHPELGNDLPVTEGRVAKELEALGIPYEHIEGGGFLARFGKKGGKTILLRADMDALPIQEETGLPFASVNPGQMHACGHDNHMTMLLGGAKLLKAHEAELKGEVMLCFQEAEERVGGAIYVVNSPKLDPKPDHCFSMHIFPSETKNTGDISCTEGGFMSSCNKVVFTVTGKSAHGSSPHTGINSIVASAKLIEELTDMMRYELDPQLPASLTICKIEGGEVSNIIPQRCTFEGTLRMFDDERREYILGRIKDIMKSVELAYRVKVDFYTEGTGLLYNDPAFTAQAREWLHDLLGDAVEPVGHKRNMVSEDFSEFSKLCPSCMFEVWSRSPEGKHYPGHNCRVLFDEDVLYRGAAAYAQVALQYLK